MGTKIVLAVAAIALGLASHNAFAEGEGNGDSFAVRTAGVTSDGRAFVQDVGQTAYPELTGRPAQPSNLAQLEPASGTEAPIQTAGSLPPGFATRTVAYAQAQSLKDYWATQILQSKTVEAGVSRPRG